MWGSLDYYVESPDMGDLLEELFLPVGWVWKSH